MTFRITCMSIPSIGLALLYLKLILMPTILKRAPLILKSGEGSRLVNLTRISESKEQV